MDACNVIMIGLFILILVSIALFEPFKFLEHFDRRWDLRN